MAGKPDRRSNGQARERITLGNGRTRPTEREQWDEQQANQGQRDDLRGGRPSQDQTEELKILYSNVQSLFGKLNELMTTTSILNPDIILLTETWTNGNITDAMLQLPGYRLEVRRNRNDTRNGIGGGLIIYVKDCFDAVPVPHNKNQFNQYCSTSIGTKIGKLNFTLVYRPPSSNVENFNNLCELLNQGCI
jgi:hypothetical protein